MKFQNFFNDSSTVSSNFVPAFCPHPKCHMHTKTPLNKNWLRKHGKFKRKDGSIVYRWICMQGHKPHTFSQTAFETTYWLKRRTMLSEIADMLTEQFSLRGLARHFGVSQNCIYGQVMRIGRHCMLLHDLALKSIDPSKLGELVFDELESWEVSQFTPTTHALFMDSKTAFKLHLHCAPINRKGRMTNEQVQKYTKWLINHGKQPENSSYKLIQNIIAYLKPIYKQSGCVRVATDEKKSYSLAIKKRWSDLKVIHMQYSGKTNRNIGIMGKINQEDQFIRQRCATMRRETLDFMKRHNNTNLRHAVYLIKRNFIMPICGTQRSQTPATRLGLVKEPLKWQEVLRTRLFGNMKELPKFMVDTYYQLNKTSFYKNNQNFRPVFIS